MHTSKLMFCTMLAISTTGCATLFADKTNTIMLVTADGHPLSDDVTVTDNGKPAQLVAVHAMRSPMCDPQIEAARGVRCTESEMWIIPPGRKGVTVNAREDHHLVVTTSGRAQTFDIGTDRSLSWFFLDLFTSGPIGITVDWVTHAWRYTTPHAITIGGGAANASL